MSLDSPFEWAKGKFGVIHIEDKVVVDHLKFYANAIVEEKVTVKLSEVHGERTFTRLHVDNLYEAFLIARSAQMSIWYEGRR
jgi:hypothetical protein